MTIEFAARFFELLLERHHGAAGSLRFRLGARGRDLGLPGRGTGLPSFLFESVHTAADLLERTFVRLPRELLLALSGGIGAAFPAPSTQREGEGVLLPGGPASRPAKGSSTSKPSARRPASRCARASAPPAIAARTVSESSRACAAPRRTSASASNPAPAWTTSPRRSRNARAASRMDSASPWDWAFAAAACASKAALSRSG